MAVLQRHRSERDISRKLRLEPMTEMGAGRAHGKAAMLVARKARSSAVTGSTPVAPEITAAFAGLTRCATPDHMRSSAAVIAPGAALDVIGLDAGQTARTALRRA